MTASELPKILTGTLIWIILIPLAFPFVIFFLIWKAIALLWVKLRYSSDEQVETLNYYDLCSGLQDVGTMICYALHAEERIDINKLRSHFHSTFIKGGLHKKFPVFYYNFDVILGYGFKRRITKELDLNFHIWERDCSPGDDVDALCWDIMMQNDKLRGKIPKWEIVVVHIPHENRSTMLFKMSHAMADAYSYFFLLNKLTGSELPKLAKHYEPSFLEKFAIYLKSPLVYWQWTREVRVGNAAKLTFGTDLKSRRYLHKDSNQAPNPKLYSSQNVDFEKIKEISKRSGTRIVHVLSAIYFWALKSRAEEVFEYVLDAKMILDPFSVAFMLPKPNHPALTEGKCTNHLTWGSILLLLNQPDRVSMLKEIQKLTDANLKSHAPIVTDFLSAILTSILPRDILFKYEFGAGGPDYLYLLTPFVAPPDQKILNIPVGKVKLLFGGDDFAFIEGIAYGSVTKGNKMEISIGAALELFEKQEDLDYHVKKIIPYEIDALWKEVCSVK